MKIILIVLSTLVNVNVRQMNERNNHDNNDDMFGNPLFNRNDDQNGGAMNTEFSHMGFLVLVP